MTKRLTNQEYIERCKKVHNNFYDYSRTNYIKSSEKINVICPIHGEFSIRADHHIQGTGCKYCGRDSRKLKISLGNSKFIEKSNKVHNNKYDYSKVNYVNSYTKVCIICPIHGEFLQTPVHHLDGEGCPKCANNIKLTTEEFIKKAKKVHDDKYDYSKVDYINNCTKVKIICKEHGEFEQIPSAHLQGQGCPKCLCSQGESIIEQYLKENNIKYQSQYIISIDKSINSSGKAYIDFYIPDYNLFIEYNGKQHYVPIEYFGGQITFEHQQKRDQYVRNYCKENSIKLLEIRYDEDIEKILYKNLNDDCIQSISCQ